MVTPDQTATDSGDNFYHLGPEMILAALEANGFRCSGHVNALNSYENRVYQIGLENKDPVIAKFYRPQRWSDACIQEELDFARELQEQELPVVAPLQNEQGDSLFHHEQFRFSVYPRVGGRAPELDNPEQLKIIGRFLARVHNISALSAFQHRRSFTIADFIEEPVRFLLENNFLPEDIKPSYVSVIDYLGNELRAVFDNLDSYHLIRLHGDCHLGNILWLNDAPFLVDLDDARTGPAVQDIWMMLSGDRTYMTARLHDILSGYTEFRDFNAGELRLIEPLRTMRLIYYAGWLARRWHDPAFPAAFPWFNTQRYWEDHVLALKEQMAIIHEEPLQWYP